MLATNPTAFTDADAREAATALVTQTMANPGAQNYAKAHCAERPALVVGSLGGFVTPT